MLALGLALQARGHRVTVAASESYRVKIENAGLPFRPIRPSFSIEDTHIVRQAMDPMSGPEYLIRTLLMPHLGDMYADLMAATQSADLMIAGEAVFAAPLVAETRKLPWAAVILAPFSLFSVYDPPLVPQLLFAKAFTCAPPAVQRMLIALARAATRKWGDPLIKLRVSLGLRPTADPLFTDRFSPLLNLLMFSDVLGSPQRDWPRGWVQTGFVFYDQPETGSAVDPRLREFLRAGPAPIVFTLGSAAVMDPGSFFEESVRAARMLGMRSLLLMGKNTPRAEPGDDLLACGYVPYSQVFPLAACAVHQGGVGTTAQALSAGVPQLVMPYAYDQPDNALRIARRGAGLWIRKDRYRAPAVAAKIRQLLTTTYTQRARLIGERVRSQTGIELACAAVERQLAALPSR